MYKKENKMDNNMVNHWGKWVDKSEPVTGVISFNDVAQFVSDEIASNGIDLQYEQALVDFEIYFMQEHARMPNDEEYDQFNNEMDGCDSGDFLIGDWFKDDAGLWDCNKENGEYAAIVRESVVQVVWSKYITKCKALCSPCYPGQCDVVQGTDEENGEFLAYNLPKEAFEY
jgi:hypothetical protein